MGTWSQLLSEQTVTSNKVQLVSQKLGQYAFKEHEATTKLPVGGRIFYMHSDNGATYKFYDSSNNELTYDSTNYRTQLATAVTYTVEGTPTADKFYVYDTINGLQKYSLYWGSYGKPYYVTADTIGSGKTNSTTMISALGDTSGTIWYYIKNTMNTNSVGGCNDWYVGSTKEQDELRTSGLVDWFASNYIWSSVEYSNNPNYSSHYWYYNKGKWDYNTKDRNYCCFAIRSF